MVQYIKPTREQLNAYLEQLHTEDGEKSLRTFLGLTEDQKADLRGVNLSGADLSRANLSGADLSGADLSGADLSETNLSRADLSRADLSGATLQGTQFIFANLSGIDLRGHSLENKYLAFTNLLGTKMTEEQFAAIKNDCPTAFIEPEQLVTYINSQINHLEQHVIPKSFLYLASPLLPFALSTLELAQTEVDPKLKQRYETSATETINALANLPEKYQPEALKQIIRDAVNEPYARIITEILPQPIAEEFVDFLNQQSKPENLNYGEFTAKEIERKANRQNQADLPPK